MRTLQLLLVGFGLVSLWAAGCGGRTEMGLPIIGDASGSGGTGGAAGVAGVAPGPGGNGGWNAGGSGAWAAGGSWNVGGSGAWNVGGSGAWSVGGSAGMYAGGAWPVAGGGWYNGGSWPVAGAAGSGAAGGSTGTCESVCAMILKQCPRSDPMCASSCEDQRAMYPECEPELDVFIACVERNGVKCGTGRNVTVAGCSTEIDTMDACLLGMPTTPPVPPQCAAFPPPPPNVSCVGSGTAGGSGVAGGAGSTTYAPMLCISSCFAGGKTWTSTCQGGKCDCAFNNSYVCTCETTQPDPCVPCCPGMY
jgi:hypothetical protein